MENWLPRFLPDHGFEVITHWGKGRLTRDVDRVPDSRHQGLLDQLPAKLRAYGKSLNPATERVLVLVDQDQDDCRELKARIESLLAQIDPRPVTMVRIATTETEAFYLGDAPAMRRAFPHLKRAELKRYSPLPEELGTWERFAEIIKDPIENKVAWAKTMGREMASDRPFPKHNQSPSFRHFCRALLTLVGEPID